MLLYFTRVVNRETVQFACFFLHNRSGFGFISLRLYGISTHENHANGNMEHNTCFLRKRNENDMFSGLRDVKNKFPYHLLICVELKYKGVCVNVRIMFDLSHWRLSPSSQARMPKNQLGKG